MRPLGPLLDCIGVADTGRDLCPSTFGFIYSTLEQYYSHTWGYGLNPFNVTRMEKTKTKKGLIPVTGRILGHEAHSAYVQEVWPAPVHCGNVFCVSEDWLGCQRSPLLNMTLARGSTGTTYP